MKGVFGMSKKKKRILIGVGVFLLLLVIVLIIIFFGGSGSESKNKRQDSFSKDFGEAEKYAEIYFDYLTSEETQERRKDEEIFYGILDLDFNHVPDLFIVDQEVTVKDNQDCMNMEFYTIVDDEVTFVIEEEVQIYNFGRIYSDLEERYYYVYKNTYSEDQKKSGSMAFVTLDTTEFKIFGSNYVELHPSTSDILALERADGREYFEMMFQEYLDSLEDVDLTSTYEAVENGISSDSTTQSDIQDEVKGNSLLKDVVSIGDYVKFPNDSMEWRVLDVGDFVILISARGVESLSASTGGGIYNLAFEDRANEYFNGYVDVAHKIPMYDLVESSYADTHPNASFNVGDTLEGDLYVIGVDYYLPNANCKGIDSPIVWVSANGKINQTYYAMDAYTRPVVYLKEEVKTTGQDETGAYLVAE